MGKIIDCKQISLKIKSEVIEEVQKVKQDNNITPTVVSILVGNDYGSIYYHNMQDKTARELGINFIKANFDKNVTEEELLSCIRKYNDDKAISYIKTAVTWLESIVKTSSWDDESKQALAELKEMVQILGIKI